MVECTRCSPLLLEQQDFRVQMAMLYDAEEGHTYASCNETYSNSI